MLQKHFTIPQKENMNQPRLEWLSPLIHSNQIDKDVLSVLIGNDICDQPFKTSIFNIKVKNNANKTTEREGTEMIATDQKTFTKNMNGCELTEGEEILQVTPEYSGCSTDKGIFNKVQFMQNACLSEVKIIELDLSKAAKARREIFLTSKSANITPMNTGTSLSSLGYREFIEAEGMLHFMDTLRSFSGRKPIGIKLCISKKEFHEICYSILKTGLIPDFIVVEGSNYGGSFPQTQPDSNTKMPLYEALLFVSKTLQTYRLEKQIKIIAYANIRSAFDVLKILALGANVVYSEMPGYTIINDEENSTSINRVQDAVDFHNNIMNDIVKMMESCGFKSISDLTLSNFFRKLDNLKLSTAEVRNGFVVNSDWQKIPEYIKD